MNKELLAFIYFIIGSIFFGLFFYLIYFLFGKESFSSIIFFLFFTDLLNKIFDKAEDIVNKKYEEK